jgi:hypothetical protein
MSAARASASPIEARHGELVRDPFAYVAHPHAVVTAPGTWLCVFNQAPRRPFVLHPPQDPLFRNHLIRSEDEGRSWSAPVVVPGYAWSGVECAGLTALRDGTVLLNQWRFDWWPLPLAEAGPDRAALAFPETLAHDLAISPEFATLTRLEHDPRRLMPWARGGGRAVVHVSRDDGLTFSATVTLDTAPFVGGYGMRGAVELADHTVVLPLGDVPAYRRIYVLRSTTGGVGWQCPVPVADDPDRLFEEPCPLSLEGGDILLLLRENRSRRLWRTVSPDAGRSWEPPVDTGIDGYPAHLLRLADGRILCTYGDREPPFAIRTAISEDEARSWRPGPDIRSGLPDRDLGYPVTLQRRDGTLVSIYYCRDAAGVTGLELTERAPC